MVYTRLSWILYQDFTRLQSKAQLGCTPFWCSGSFSKFTWFLAEFSSRQQWHLGLCFLVVYWLDAAPSSYRPLTVPYHVAALTGPPSTWQLTSSESARQRLIPQSHISLQATLLKTAHTHTHTHTHTSIWWEWHPIAFPIFSGLEARRPQVLPTLKGKDHTRRVHLHLLGVILWSIAKLCTTHWLQCQIQVTTFFFDHQALESK